MEHPNVRQLDDYRTDVEAKQAAIRRKARDVAARVGDDAPVAGFGATIAPSGRMRTCIIGVEPEHVPDMLDAVEHIRNELVSFQLCKKCGS